jgi:hypothetical protein
MEKKNITLAKGFEFDLIEAWKKITERQFGGDPARAFSELIQNALDSYDLSIPWQERKIEITSDKKSISITDYGTGMNMDKIQLLLTLGGTDKSKDNTKIGRFGIGFFSIFNHKLGTKQVTVRTKCDGDPVFIEFLIKNPNSIPTLRAGVLEESMEYSTQIEVLFDNAESVNNCIKKSQDSLFNYPCNSFINGEHYKTIWDRAVENKDKIFYTNDCHGIIQKTKNFYRQIVVLCHYEYITALSFTDLGTGGRNLKFDLRDYDTTKLPLIPDVNVTINCDSLRLVISRDSIYMDNNYKKMIEVIREKLLDLLDERIKEELDSAIIIANQYILREEIRNYLNSLKKGESTARYHKAIISLARADVYAVNGLMNSISIEKVMNSKKPELPLFYSVDKSNLRWLGGAFKHDFILLPQPCRVKGGAPYFYDLLFGKLFDDVINLDTIDDDKEKLNDLINRGIVSKESLNPQINKISERDLSTEEGSLLHDITMILSNDYVKSILGNTLGMPINSIVPFFYQIDNKEVQIATGIFDTDGKPYSLEMALNMSVDEDDEVVSNSLNKDLLLGLQVNHPFISYLIKTNDPYKAYYMLTFVSNELALSQKLLVPYSPLFYLTKEKITTGMRKALIHHLLNPQRG